MKRVEADDTSARSCRTPAPASIVCRACTREFFAHSLPIHQKTCFQTNAFVELKCGKCHSSVRRVLCSESGIFHKHELDCVGAPEPNVIREAKTACQRGEHHEADEINSAEADGRVRCKKCDRAFAEDRIVKHQSVCHEKPRAAVKVAMKGAKKPEHSSVPANSTRCYRPQLNSSEAAHRASKVVNISLQQQKQLQKPSVGVVQACARRSYDFRRHFSDNSANENVRERDKKRFDIVLRDAPLQTQHHGSLYSQPNTRFGLASGLSAKSADLLASNVTSAANPLATSRLMTPAATSSSRW